ncbi:MAG: class I mannose-6-phosphate isomerase [Chloroflexi bacterium]|nr:class I mannose-6-phosphate isomerase [Chloroflexota bacterium]
MIEVLQQPILVTPEYRDYVWGGQRLRPGQLTAEAWIVYESDRVAAGPLQGRTLAQVAAEFGSALLGARAIDRTGSRFPILIKLLDCAAWLSLQVHPNDEQARQLEGPDQFGKTEAWHILDAEPAAEILCGLRDGTSAETLAQAVRGGTLLDHMQRLNVNAGDTVFIRAGTIHALGPGLMLYEIQQTSNLTYRVFDWNRPASDGRPLHIDQSLAVTDLKAVAPITPPPAFVDGQATTLINCDYFTLELLTAETNSIDLATRGESFHALTVIDGQAIIEGDEWQVPLHRHQTALIPAACDAYRVRPQGKTQLLKAAIP